MKSRKKKYSTKASKKKSPRTFKLICIIILLMIPVLYGLYLCIPEHHIPSSSLQASHSSVSLPQTANLEIPGPIPGRQEQIIRHKGYTVSYNKEWRLPNWVAYELTPQETRGKEKRDNHFISDPQVIGSIATNSDYARSGYDKGHMAPAADMKWNNIAMKESFYFSNICPQHPELNRRKWKDLEEKIREWCNTDSCAIIVCGPIVDNTNKTIGTNRIVIPQRFYKVILLPYARSPRAIGFIFDNKRSVEPLKNYAVTVDSIEEITHIDFFSSLPDSIEGIIESHFNAALWGL